MVSRTSSGRSKIHRSKKDWWLTVTLCISALACGWAVIQVWLDPGTVVFKAVLSLVCLLTVVLCLWILAGTYYVVGRNVLLVRSGPFRWRITLNSIRKVEPTRSPRSSAALSLDRLHIRYDKHSEVMISPEDKDAFLRDLVAACPRLRYDGKRVVSG